MNTNDNGGLRERKKTATREALSTAALNLALEHGPQNVRVDDIAEAAGVSPRTYNNYFSSREQAIVTAVAAERALRLSAALRARPADEPLADAVIETVVAQYGADGLPAGDLLRLITSTPGLQAEYVGTVAAIEQPLASAIAARTADSDSGSGGSGKGTGTGTGTGENNDFAAAVLAAAVSAAVRVAVERWLRPMQEAQRAATTPSGLVVPNGVLTDLLREALGHLTPTLQAADPRS